MQKLNFLDCTLRDGGYYNAWDFPRDVIQDYLKAMQATGVDVVELGFRFWHNEGFKGACAFTTDDFVRSLEIPPGLSIGVMVNAADLIEDGVLLQSRLERLFPEPASTTSVNLVRIACHIHEFATTLPVSHWLSDRGFRVGFNLMQIADRTEDEIKALAHEASKWSLDVLYFADSMGSMTPDHTARVVGWLRENWKGALGIHTHDNLSLALQNSLRALDAGVTWLDSTVTGMGRGPGNAKTEQLALEIAERRDTPCNLVPLIGLINRYFGPEQKRCGWGTNIYYYLTGKYGIHPSYIQEMLSDSRYSEEDVVAVINHLRHEGGKQFSLNTLDAARYFYQGEPRGSWSPASLFEGREVLLLGTGPGVGKHRDAIERYIRQERPVVIALNTQSAVDSDLIDVRVACHPVRLLADCATHTKLPQPLITPASMLPDDVREALAGKELLDYGLTVQPDRFEFAEYHCVLPSSLVIAYALAVVTSGRAKQVLLAGFDGYGVDDRRNAEMANLFSAYSETKAALQLIAITPTRYGLQSVSIYALRD